MTTCYEKSLVAVEGEPLVKEFVRGNTNTIPISAAKQGKVLSIKCMGAGEV